MLIRIWQFRARADKVADFRAAYGPGGDWARLFRRAPGYSGTELLESTMDPAIFVTLDRWESAAAWEAFLRAWSEAYTALDRECEPLVHDEAEVGTFHSPAA